MAKEDGRDQIPVPDPTTLTTQQLYREITALEKFLAAQITAMAEKIAMRIEGMEKLSAQKFDAIDMQFTILNERLEVESRDRTLAIDTALQAQKEAAEKVEERFSKDIASLSELVATKTDGLEREFRAKLEALQSFQSRLGAGE